MAAEKYNLSMWQGDTFTLTLTIKESGAVKNLTGYTARMQIRSSYDATSVTESLTTANGEITITANSGTIALQLSAARTAAITVNRSTSQKPPRNLYVYDLELIDSDSKVTKLIYGDVTVYGEVTR